VERPGCPPSAAGRLRHTAYIVRELIRWKLPPGYLQVKITRVLHEWENSTSRERAAPAAGEVRAAVTRAGGVQAHNQAVTIPPVTAADRENEPDHRRRMLTEAFPEDGACVGEEGARGGKPQAGRRWIIDPIGRHAGFPCAGFPGWAVFRSVSKWGVKSTAGSGDLPVLGQTFVAARRREARTGTTRAVCVSEIAKILGSRAVRQRGSSSSRSGAGLRGWWTGWRSSGRCARSAGCPDAMAARLRPR